MSCYRFELNVNSWNFALHSLQSTNISARLSYNSHEWGTISWWKPWDMKWQTISKLKRFCKYHLKVLEKYWFQELTGLVNTKLLVTLSKRFPKKRNAVAGYSVRLCLRLLWICSIILLQSLRSALVFKITACWLVFFYLWIVLPPGKQQTQLALWCRRQTRHARPFLVS